MAARDIRGLADRFEPSLEPRFGSGGLRPLPEIARIPDANALQAMHWGIKSAQSPEKLHRIYQNQPIL